MLKILFYSFGCDVPTGILFHLRLPIGRGGCHSYSSHFDQLPLHVMVFIFMNLKRMKDLAYFNKEPFDYQFAALSSELIRSI